MKKLCLLLLLPSLVSCEGFKMTIPISYKFKDGGEITMPITFGQTKSAKTPKTVTP